MAAGDGGGARGDRTAGVAAKPRGGGPCGRPEPAADGSTNDGADRGRADGTRSAEHRALLWTRGPCALARGAGHLRRHDLRGRAADIGDRAPHGARCAAISSAASAPQRRTDTRRPRTGVWAAWRLCSRSRHAEHALWNRYAQPARVACGQPGPPRSGADCLLCARPPGKRGRSHSGFAPGIGWTDRFGRDKAVWPELVDYGLLSNHIREGWP